MARRGETKRRIVEEAREAFNAVRYGQVTTAILAARLGLSEGNLWYHFKTKRDLLAAIQADFAAETQAQLDTLSGIEDPVEAYGAFLKAWRDLFSRFLFVFRDRSDYGAHSPDMIAVFPVLYQTLQAQMTTLFQGLAAAGKLSVDPDDIPDLVFNTILITRFYFEFQDERAAPLDKALPAQSEDAVLHHQTLFKGRLCPQVQARVRAVLRS